MVLVEYSDSESDVELTSHSHGGVSDSGESPTFEHDNTRKRKAEEQAIDTAPRSKLPPLPSSFHSLYASNVRTSTTDDPSLHGGRKRQVPHVQGNWPSHVYLEWFPDKQALVQLENIIEQACTITHREQKINKFLRSDLGAQLPLHVSLSAPLVLTSEIKDDFLAALINAIDAAKVDQFTVTASGLDWVSNAEGSRCFLVLRLSSPAGNELNKLLRICNQTCQQFGLATLYQERHVVGIDRSRRKSKAELTRKRISPKSLEHVKDVSNAFHISIAWTLDKPSDEETNAARQLDLDALLTRQYPISFQTVKIKIGNSIQDVQLI